LLVIVRRQPPPPCRLPRQHADAAVIEKIRRSAIQISKNRGVELSEFKIVNQDPPALSDKSVVDAMEFAAKQLNLEYKKMISRAYHDSLFMAR
jgi:ureidoglycolate amidohydrolase